MTLAFLAAPASAQQAVSLPLFGGAMFLKGEVAVLDDQRGADGSQQLTVWRPVLFGEPDKPIGGRMDCRLAGVTQPFDDAEFDLAARYEASRPRRRESGLKDDTVTPLDEGGVRRLIVTGSVASPHKHYVLTYYAQRAGDAMYDVRLNCEFVHMQAIREVDYAALVHRYIALEPAPVTGTPDAQTL